MARSKCSFALRIAVPQGGSFTVSTLGALSTGCTRADTAVRLLKLDHIEVVSKLARGGERETRGVITDNPSGSSRG
eukprot:scaffold21642_cov63-Phaeocystis_antarctica.AAC.5